MTKNKHSSDSWCLRAYISRVNRWISLIFIWLHDHGESLNNEVDWIVFWIGLPIIIFELAILVIMQQCMNYHQNLSFSDHINMIKRKYWWNPQEKQSLNFELFYHFKVVRNIRFNWWFYLLVLSFFYIKECCVIQVVCSVCAEVINPLL